MSHVRRKTFLEHHISFYDSHTTEGQARGIRAASKQAAFAQARHLVQGLVWEALALTPCQVEQIKQWHREHKE